MPYNPDGSFSLINGFGSGTLPDNNFPNQVGQDLTDIANGIAISSLIAAFGSYTGSPNVLTTNTTAQTAVGYTFTSFNAGTISSGTFVPDPTKGNYQYLTCNGAFIFAPPTPDSALDILITMGPSAATITFSGFVVSSVTGDALVYTNGFRFYISIRRVNSVPTYLIKALQ